MAEPWDLSKARKMRNAGAFWEEIGKRFGCNAETAHLRCDSVYRTNRNRRLSAARLANDYFRAPTQRTHRVESQEARNPIEPPPFDTRSLTAFMFGDPLPGRSALDRRVAST